MICVLQRKIFVSKLMLLFDNQVHTVKKVSETYYNMDFSVVYLLMNNPARVRRCVLSALCSMVKDSDMGIASHRKKYYGLPW